MKSRKKVLVFGLLSSSALRKERERESVTSWHELFRNVDAEKRNSNELADS
jgi:hypothetical protein